MRRGLRAGRERMEAAAGGTLRARLAAPRAGGPGPAGVGPARRPDGAAAGDRQPGCADRWRAPLRAAL
ncbi:hypothetical protein G6F50_017907 [Rhizopus delemar]|uniref:Uncharacterized protein n=1 Tax=Rhizopus delemar TaxID=936053 RepID=A0A9P6XPS5_9FUNG|nr:hypothetical protein G6F50_017907 [Rhizopus delemar]